MYHVCKMQSKLGCLHVPVTLSVGCKLFSSKLTLTLLRGREGEREREGNLSTSVVGPAVKFLSTTLEEREREVYDVGDGKFGTNLTSSNRLVRKTFSKRVGEKERGGGFHWEFFLF